MSSTFVIRNQNDQFLEKKSGAWVDGSENRSIFRTPHKDEALNQVVELTVKNPDLRVSIVAVDISEKGLLQLPVCETAPEESPVSAAEDSIPTAETANDSQSLASATSVVI